MQIYIHPICKCKLRAKEFSSYQMQCQSSLKFLQDCLNNMLCPINDLHFPSWRLCFVLRYSFCPFRCICASLVIFKDYIDPLCSPIGLHKRQNILPSHLECYNLYLLLIHCLPKNSIWRAQKQKRGLARLKLALYYQYRLSQCKSCIMCRLNLQEYRISYSHSWEQKLKLWPRWMLQKPTEMSHGHFL